jgi:hypothetical protein
VDSVGDASADDLLRFLYDLVLRQPTGWGWVAASAFAALPAWLAIVCLFDGNVVGGLVLLAMAGVIPGLRYYLLQRNGFALFRKQEVTAVDG